MRHRQDQPVLFKSKAMAVSMGSEDQIVTEGQLLATFSLFIFLACLQVVSGKQQRYPP